MPLSSDSQYMTGPTTDKPLYLHLLTIVVSCFVHVLLPLILDPLSFVQSEQRAERNQSDSESEEEETNPEVEDSVGKTTQCNH